MFSLEEIIEMAEKVILLKYYDEVQELAKLMALKQELGKIHKSN